MKPVWRFVLVLLLLATGAQRLPAPIQEIPQPTPVPKSKRETPLRPKSKPEAIPKRSPNLSFAGTWTGIVFYKCSDGSSSSSNYVVKISDDQKTVLVNIAAVGKTMSGPPTPFSCTRFQEALTWSDSNNYGITTYTMKINSDGAASLLREMGFGDGDTCTYTGTLSRQDVSSASSIPQTMATIAAPQTTGVPTAKSVPDKPGFVYNPFDSSSKRLLDVRGIASGTKVKDPSGKLFIVP